jgi:hypothetical protein
MMRILAAVALVALGVAACAGGGDDDLDALVAFARQPSDETWSELPLADDVDLGLGHHLREVRAARELRDPAAWRLEMRRFRGGAGRSRR